MWSVADPPLTRLAVHETHRTVMLLLPVLMLGWAGQAARPGASSRADVMPWFRVWCLAASIGLGLGLTGLGVNVLLCVLLWWWRVPSGLADLRALIGHSRTGGGVRYVGVLVGMVLAILAVPGLRGWFGGVLMGWLLLTEGM